MPTATSSALEAAVAKIDTWFKRPAAPVHGQLGFEAYTRHLEREARVEAIRDQHAAAITEAKGYNPDLGAIYGVGDTVAFLADQVEASGVAVVREAYGFRTMTAAEKAAAAQAKRVAA